MPRATRPSGVPADFEFLEGRVLRLGHTHDHAGGAFQERAGLRNGSADEFDGGAGTRDR